jgi:hypothetical protein
MMPEGLSPSEVGKEIAEHHEHHVAAGGGQDGSDGHGGHGSERVLTILEAILLALVAVLAAYSGFASAKWSTESSLHLAKSSTVRNLATRAELTGLTTKNFDASTFNAWFTAYLLGDTNGMAVAERRFRPPFDVAFKAWMATNPFSNPNAPMGPTSMPEYVQPDQAQADALDAEATNLYNQGEHAAEISDEYVRDTVFLATVLFIVGISGHFRVRSARKGLIGVGVAILLVAVGFLLTTPRPPL